MSKKILGLDIASSTGFCILNDGKLEKYGVITIPSEMNLFQRIKYFENNLIQILNDNKPDEVHIEDVILGISGAKTLAYLGRLNGVAISVCYNKVGDNIKLYTPVTWKANSFKGLGGMAKKAEIQIAVIRHFNLIPEDELAEIIKPITQFNEDDQTLKEQLNLLRKKIDTLTKVYNRKKTTDQEKDSIKPQIDEGNKKISEMKKLIKKRVSDIQGIYNKVSISLTAKCGLTPDVSDSIGIAYCNV